MTFRTFIPIYDMIFITSHAFPKYSPYKYPPHKPQLKKKSAINESSPKPLLPISFPDARQFMLAAK